MTTDELSKLLDEKLQPVTTELETLNGRLEAVEDVIERTKPSGFRVIEIQNQLQKVEKRLTQLSGKVEKTATKDDLKALEKRQNSKFDDLFDHIDKFASNTAQRVRHIEKHVDIPPFEPIAVD